MNDKITIEDIVLSNDKRYISTLRPFLPASYCEKAARLIIEHPGTIFITTGFYTMGADSIETDGPAGAAAIARAIKNLGYDTYFVIDQFASPIIKAMVQEFSSIIIFPVMNNAKSDEYASELIRKYQPSVLISIERCGITEDGTYLNISGVDISSHNAKVDYLFLHHDKTIGICDGCNEIGMGNLNHIIKTIDYLPEKPSVTKVSDLVIASVSNWGAYGLVAALSILKDENLLPIPGQEERLIEHMINLGAVDGITKQRTRSVDGFTVMENNKILLRLHEFLKRKV